MTYFRSAVIDGKYIGEVEISDDKDPAVARVFNESSALRAIEEFMPQYHPSVFIHELNICQEMPRADRIRRVVHAVVVTQNRGPDEAREAELIKKYMNS